MKKHITLFAMLMACLRLSAQQDPQFSQYMYNKLFMNPAYAGMKNSLCATLIGRQQWSGFDGAPKSAVLSVDCILPEQYSGGVGMHIMTDQLGFEKNMHYAFDYSFHRNYSFGTIAAGLQLGAYTKHLGPSGTQQWVATTNWNSDQTIPPSINKTVFDMGFGLWFQGRNSCFGVSSTHLNGKTIDAPDQMIGSVNHDLRYQIARHYFITGGMTIFPHQTWEIRPSFLIKTDASVTSFDLNVIALFRNRFWFGTSYRYQDAVCPMAGFQLESFRSTSHGPSEQSMRIGFAYDYTTSNLRNYSNGTFEVLLNYCTPIEFRTTRWGDPRIFD